MTARPEQNILLLCADSARHIGTVGDHIDAFRRFSRHNVVALDSVIASKLDIDLTNFDAIVFHYSIVISTPHYLPAAFIDKLAAFEGPKILFIQDEFRWVDRTTDTIKRLGISVIFTVVNDDVVRKIYRDSYFDTVRFEPTLTGFVPEDLIARPTPEYGDRAIDVSYRARKLPGWCGSFALQKWQIGERFLCDAERYGLKCDIATSETSRMYGENWVKFIANSKAVLGTESGASFVDYSGDVHLHVEDYEALHPYASFDDIRDRFLEGRDGEVVIRVISPRCFEAASLRTLMIMYPAEYSGILKPWRHYVPLERDHSNMDEVVAVLRDSKHAGEIIETAYEEIAKSARWTYNAFINHFDDVIHDVAPKAAERDLRPEQVEAEMARQLAQLRELEKRYQRRAKWAHLRTRVLLFIQRLRGAAIEFVSHRFPKPIASPLLFLDQVCKNALKYVWRRLRREHIH